MNKDIKEILDDRLKNEDIAIEIKIRIAKKDNNVPFSSSTFVIDDCCNITHVAMVLAELEKYKHELLTKYYLYDFELDKKHEDEHKKEDKRSERR